MSGKGEPQYRLVSEFLGLRCAPDLLTSGVFPNGKEISESMAAFRAARTALAQTRFGDPSVTLYDVGSGSSPRTGALFACMSRWRCFAIDPNLNWPQDNVSRRFRRLVVLKRRIEDVCAMAEGLAVIALVHAHVAPLAALRSIDAPSYLVIAMPCCMALDLPIPALFDYEEAGCWSAKRRVRVWRISRSQRNEMVGLGGDE